MPPRKIAGFDVANNRHVYTPNTILIPVSGQFAAQNNEVNGWGQLGPFDNTNSQDFGNYASYTTLNNLQVGGLRFPFDVRFVELDIIHRNNAGATDEWKWLIYTQEKTPGSTTRVTQLIYDGALNNYGNNEPQQTQIVAADLIDPPNDTVLTAGHFWSLAVGTPTQAANRNIQCYGGWILFEVA